MSLTGITFSNQKITPSDDGRLYGAMLSDGILTGCGITFAAATLSIAAGSLLIGTRELRTSGETLSITGATSGYARVIVDIDLTRAATKASFEQAQFQVEYAASPDAFPALEQQDINTAGTHYQASFCVVSLGEAGITGVVSSLGAAQVPTGRIPVTETPGNAGAHNAIYRGKNLGSAVTSAQWAAIQAGTFEDLFIGDYWTINDVNWRIAAFDYYYNTGDVLCTTHHVVIVPEASLYETAMNSSQSTEGGYVASTMYTSGLAAALATVKSAFGDDHILTHRQIFCNAVTNGIPSGYGFYDNQIALMTEQNVFGGKFYGAAKTSTQTPSLMTLDNAQYPLFAHNHALINVPDKWVGLRDVVSATSYARVTSRGSPDFTANITNPIAVRPAFSIKA